MHRFLNNLVRSLRLTNPARTIPRTPRRTTLQLEALESRTVMSTTATQAGSALLVNVDPGFAVITSGHGGFEFIPQITFQSDPHEAGKLDVLYFGNLLLQPIPIASINNVMVTVAGLDSINVDDTNGFPFAAGTTIALSGGGSGNSLNLTGSIPISGREFYAAGTGALGGSLSLPGVGVTFAFSDAVGSVADLVHAGALLVSTSGPDVSLSGSDGVTQTLSGLGSAGGTLTCSNQFLVELDQNAANARVSLNATEAAAGEQGFALLMHGANDEAVLSVTPSTVFTDVHADDGNAAFVNLLTNSGQVSVEGNSSVNVTLGEAGPNGLSTTAGIKANVFVADVGHLVLRDSGNVTTQENVAVTESTISGNGLFGNDAVTLSYFRTARVSILTGQLADTYSVVGSQAGAHFDSKITIEDFSGVGLNVQVALDSGSGLDLHLNNTVLAKPAPASLFLSAPGGTFSDLTPNQSVGTEDVSFAGGLTSQVHYKGFTSVTLNNLHRGI